MSTELENNVLGLLHGLHIDFHREKPIKTRYGTWKVDFYIDSKPPIVLSCKGLGERGLKPSAYSGTAKEMACIAFTEFYELKQSSLPKDTFFILVYGGSPLKTREHDFPELFRSLGVHVISINEKEALERFIFKCAPSLMPMAYLKMAKEPEVEAKKADQLASVFAQTRKESSEFYAGVAESSRLYAESLRKISKGFEEAIRTASPPELEKIIDMWLLQHRKGRPSTTQPTKEKNI